MTATQSSENEITSKEITKPGNALAGALALCVFIWAIVFGICYNNYVHERQRVMNGLILLSEQLIHHSYIMLNNADLALQQSAEHFIRDWDEISQNPIESQKILAQTFASIFYLEDVRILKPDGATLMSYHHDDQQGEKNIPLLLDDTHIISYLDKTPGLSIKAQPDTNLLLASYPIYDDQADLKGYVLARLKTDLINSFYEKGFRSHHFHFSLMNAKGVLLQSAPDITLEQELKNFSTNQETRLAPLNDFKYFQKASNFNISVAASVRSEFALSDWRRLTYIYVLVGLVLSCMVLFYSVITQRSLNRLQKENEIRRKAQIELQKLSQAIEQSPVSVVITNKDAQIEYVNPKFSENTGYSSDEIIGQNPRILHADEKSITDYQQMWGTLASGQDWHGEFYNKRKDGSTFWERASLSPIVDSNGEITHYVAVKEDITDKKQSEEQLSLAAAVFETAAEGLMVCDADTIIETVNKSFTEITGYSEEEIIGQKPSLFKSGYHDETFFQILYERLQRYGLWEGEIWNKRKNGDIYPQWLSIKALKDENGEILHYISLINDITVRKQNEERILYQANYDALTDLPNRSLFKDRLRQAIHGAERTGTQVALMFIDLDRFKHVNDTLGHACGDLLLQEASRRLSKLVRKTDTVARLGGDEFTVIISDLSDFRQIENLVDKMLKKLSAPYDLENNRAYVSASIGITIFPNDATNMDDLLKNADAAMYKAKEGGRNLSHFFTKKMNDQARERRNLEIALHQALEREEFALHYQPIIDAATGQLASCECLLRWHQPEHGNVYPDTFIPLAEDTGLILPIGEWVLKKACFEAKIWHRYTKAPPKVSVNMSSKQFQRTNVVDLVKNTLLETELPADQLTLEITESLLIGDDSQIMNQLNGLRDLDVGLSIDDFGTGYSSLSYLRRFPITTLKIDRAFVMDLPDDEEANALISAILSMADSLKLNVVAEGVETKDQLNRLKEGGCGFIQGYYYSPPLPIEAFRSIVKKQGPLHPDE
ncbi:MAG: EAL domain-containing protein [Methylocystaceae bacterium]|nr:EAL domain-containing protein [Methylocystaceae bacterium]